MIDQERRPKMAKAAGSKPEVTSKDVADALNEFRKVLDEYSKTDAGTFKVNFVQQILQLTYQIDVKVNFL